MHSLAPDSEYLPEGQTVHASFVAPLEYFPAAHNSHSRLIEARYLPAPQGEQLPQPDTKETFPEGQGLQEL
tara:strand:- start:2542 stop:2754 length:213 start_codon:yes stop_codon:yes gene_type:complete